MNGPRISVVGTGANGAALAADMIRAGHDVTLIEQWPEHVEVMRRDGITVEFPDVTEVTPAEVYHLCEVAEMRAPFDVVFTSVKTYDTRWVAELVKPVMREDSIFVGLQNGMTIDAVGGILGEQRNVGAVLGIAANMYEPGRIIRQVSREVTWFTVGLAAGGVDDRVREAARALSAAGRCETTGDIRASKWMKLIANIPEMLPSAILGLPLLSAVDIDGVRPVMDEAAREAYRLARQLDITMLPIFGKSADEVPDSDSYASDLLQAVLDHYSLPDTRVAVLQDWDKGRRAELDAFCGYIVDKQRELGGSAPVNEAILRIAERVESGELSPSPDNADLIRAIPVP